jgi:hypothetical protein
VDDPSCQTIVLVGNPTEIVTIDRNLTITAVERPGLPPAVGTLGERAFTILPGNTVTFEDFDIHDSGGASVEQGGGIYNEGTLTLNKGTSVTSNVASGEGGGVYNHGTLYLCGAKVSDNQAPPGTENNIAGTRAQQCPTGSPGGGPQEGNRVLIEHKGKELCLPEAALKGHLKHGDEVIDEEGCSDSAAKKNGRNGHQGMGIRGGK